MHWSRNLILVSALVLLALAGTSSKQSVRAQTIGDVDCDGVVSSIDASVILQYSAGLLASLPCNGAADPNGDGRTTAVDATVILQVVAGFIHDLPGEKPLQQLLGRPGVITFVGSGSIYQGPRRAGFAYPASAHVDAGGGVRQEQVHLLPKHLYKSHAAAPAGAIPPPGPTQDVGIAPGNPELDLTFNGLTARDQELARLGQDPAEPPDQGLCVGNGYVLESVNSALRVYTMEGVALISPIALSQFYGYPDSFDPETLIFSVSIFDVSCYYDTDSGRWFHIAATIDRDPVSGAWVGPDRIDLAVSETGDPLGSWNYYAIPTQNDGSEGTPNHYCSLGPCLGDFPHMGADANGIYVTTNEFPLLDLESAKETDTFTGVNLYAISKAQLVLGRAHPAIVQFSRFENPFGGLAYRVWPAISPAGIYEEGGNGTAYFVSDVECYTCRGDDRMVVWAMQNTESLDSGHPMPRLLSTVVLVNPYTTLPPLAEQPAGSAPIRDCINDTAASTPFGAGCWRYGSFAEPPHDEVESILDPGLDINQVYFADGSLWTAQTTTLTMGGEEKNGIAYYILRPSLQDTGVDVSVEREGQFGLNNNHLIFPTVAATSAGRGVISFTLVGEDHFASAAYVTLDRKGGVGDVHVAAAGVGPVDGYSGYNAFNSKQPAVQRFGDYGAAAVDGDTIWAAAEYIGQTCTLAEYLTDTKPSPLFSCASTRTWLANWYTRISKLTP